MSGAPEGAVLLIVVNFCNMFLGDIFQVEVLSNDQLERLDDPASFMLSFVTGYCKDASWSEQFAFVQNIRSVLYFDAEVCTEDHNEKVQACLIDGLAELRSSTLRNAIMCTGLYLQKISLNTSQFRKLVNAMIVKTAGSPKFIIDLAEKSLDDAFAGVDALTVTTALVEATNHKNTDVASKALVLINRHIGRLDANAEGFADAFHPVFESLAVGLNAKKVPGKESARLALRYLLSVIGEEEFLAEVARCTLAESQVKLVHKEVVSKGKARVPLAETK